MRFGSFRLGRKWLQNNELTYDNVSKIQGGSSTYYQMVRHSAVQPITQDYVTVQKTDVTTERVNGQNVNIRKEMRNLKTAGPTYTYRHHPTFGTVSRAIPLEVMYKKDACAHVMSGSKRAMNKQSYSDSISAHPVHGFARDRFRAYCM